MDLYKLNEICLKYTKELPIAFEIFGTYKRYAYFAPQDITLDKESWIIRKRNSCLRFEMSTMDLNVKNKADEQAFLKKYALDGTNFTLTPGAVPIKNDENVLEGVLTITGLTPEEDHHLALKILNELEPLD